MNLKDIDLRENYRLWKRNLGPFRCFFRSSAFVSLQTYDDFILKDLKLDLLNISNDRLIKRILQEIYKNNFVIIDLELDKILDFSFILNNKYNVKPILNLNLLFHPYGEVGTCEDINKLLIYGERLKKIPKGKFVMLIPYDRYREDEKLDENKLNNQYEVTYEDLPCYDFLKFLNYNEISVFTKDKVKADLDYYIKDIEKNIKVNLIESGEYK